MQTAEKWLYWSALLVGLYLVLKNAGAFDKIIGSIGGEYTDAIATLQGRNIPYSFGR